MSTKKNPEMKILSHSALINRNDTNPLYHQLYMILRDRILDGEWKPGDLLPPEPELMKIYQVSRITVRQAVERLANENLVYKRRGKGTFVTLTEFRTDASKIIGFEKDMRQRGYEPETQILEKKLVRVSRVTAEKLGINDGDELAHIQRLRLANGIPISVEDSFLVHEHCPKILDHIEFETGSLFDILEKHYGIRIESAQETISAMMPPKGMQEFLHISEQQALLYIERISYSQLNIPIEYQRIHYRADRYALELTLKL